jgi:hypothetical protein
MNSESNLCVLILLRLLQWLIAQLIRSSVPTAVSSTVFFENIERTSWKKWEAGWSESDVVNPLPIPIYNSNSAPPDLSRPFIARGLLNNTDILDKWTPDFFAASPQGDVEVDYFRDAREFNTVPDAIAPLRTVIHNITQGGYEKFGTEKIFRKYPALLNQLPLAWFTNIFGDYFSPEKVGLQLAVPLFYGRGQHGRTTRTDTH